MIGAVDFLRRSIIVAMADRTNVSDCLVTSQRHCHSLANEIVHCSARDDDYLVRVRAQVMTRDDSSGGWLPTHGGGMSMVGLRSTPSDGTQYLITGQRVSDQAVVLDCTVNDDLLYVKATPTFHHWRTRGKRFGLTFHSSADAHVFETCIQQATQQLQDIDVNKENISEIDDEIAVLKLHPPIDTKEVSSLPASRTRTPSPTATMRIYNNGGSNAQRLSTSFAPPSSYHPFSCPHLDFAVERSFYRRYVAGTEKGLGGHRGHAQENGHVNCDVDVAAGHALSSGDEVFGEDAAVRTDGYVRFSRTDVSTDNCSLASKAPVTPSAGTNVTADGSLKAESSSHTTDSSHLTRNDSSHLTLPHDYEYPALVPTCSRPRQLSVTPTVDQVVLPRRKDKKRTRRRNKTIASSTRARCIYCQELYFVTENGRGACPDAPDDCAACIERATCLCAARALLYHCATDEDGSYGPVCGFSDSSPAGSGSPASSSSERRRRRRKWVLLALLSVVLPCLWCYPALAACHSCAVRHGHCGARHRAV